MTIVAKKTRLGLDLKGGVELVYQGKPTAQSKVNAESLEPGDRHHAQARRPARRRPAGNPALGQKTKSTSRCRTSATRTRAENEVGKTAQLYFYDWEPNVIGPDGKPAPTEPTVTGGRERGLRRRTGLAEYQAVLRAAKRPPILRKTRHDLAAGLHPRSRSTDASTAAGT